MVITKTRSGNDVYKSLRFRCSFWTNYNKEQEGAKDAMDAIVNVGK